MVDELATEAPVTTETVPEPTPVIDDIFGGMLRANTVFEPEKEEPPAAQESPVVPETSPPVEEVIPSKQTQYWQSQSDKLKNENETLKQQLETAKKTELPEIPQPKVEAKPEVKPFPGPPTRPVKPRGFSREDALEPTSESAKYLDEVEEWRNTMVEYNGLKSEYSSALQQETVEKIHQEQQQRVEVERKRRVYHQELNDIASEVQEKYKATQEQTADFLKRMSDPKSVSIDNLWKLYCWEKGIAQPGVNSQTPTPSQDFKQSQLAQTVPGDMGVIPSANTGTASPADTIMNDMVKTEQRNQPF